jgi:hypothetical protein
LFTEENNQEINDFNIKYIFWRFVYRLSTSAREINLETITIMSTYPNLRRYDMAESKDGPNISLPLFQHFYILSILYVIIQRCAAKYTKLTTSENECKQKKEK